MLKILFFRRNEYVPKVPSCNAALMVALLLNHVPGKGMAKERLMVLAEEIGVSGNESMGGDGGFYDGWAGVKQLLQGDPALVRKEKGNKYSLTTQVSPYSIKNPRILPLLFTLNTLAARDVWSSSCTRPSHPRS